LIASAAQILMKYDLEKISAAVHESWIESKLRLGITSRKSETGEELMVPYEQMSEEAKELDRSSVRTVIAAIRSLI
jgi:hypothetical protein